MKAASFTAGLAVLLATAVGGVVAAESATVTVTVPAQIVETHVTLTGRLGAGQVPTHSLKVQATESFTGIATPTVVGTYATGTVVFTFDNGCVPHPQYLCSTTIRIPAGADVSTVGGLHYVTVAEALFSGSPPVSSGPTAIRAVAVGSASNTGPNTITQFGTAPGPVTVRNPAATTGGSERTTLVIAEDDYDTVLELAIRKCIGDLNTFLRPQELRSRARITGLPDLTITDDHQVGDETPSFTITVSGTLEANAFYEADVRMALKRALAAAIPSDEQLLATGMNYYIVSFPPSGDVQIAGTALGWVVPNLPTPRFQSEVARMSVDQATTAVERRVPGAHVQIDVWPRGTPRMPVDPGRITFRVVASQLPA